MGGQGLKQREQVIVCRKTRTLGALGARDLWDQVQGKVASPGREVGGKAGWGTVIRPAVNTSCCFWLFCVKHVPLPRNGTQTQVLYQLGTRATPTQQGWREILPEREQPGYRVFSVNMGC